MYMKTTVVFAAVLAASAVTADTITINGVEWTYTDRNDIAKTVTLGGNGLSMDDPRCTIGQDVEVDASTIPWSFEIDGETYKVSHIGNYAFFKCSGLYGTITIPSHVTSIGKTAFRGAGTQEKKLYLASLGGVTNIASYAFEDAEMQQNFPDLSRVTTYSLATFQKSPFTGAARISPSASKVNNSFFVNSSTMTGVFVPGPATVISGVQKNTIVGCNDFTRGAASCRVIFAGPNTKTENANKGTMLQDVENCTVFAPVNGYWDELVTGGSNNKVIFYGASTNLNLVVDDDARTITATPADEVALTDILSAAPALKEVFGWNTFINITNTIEVAADAITAEMISGVSFNSMLMTFKVKTQSQLDNVLAAVPQTTMLAIDATDAKTELVVPSDRALWVWLGGNGKYMPHIIGLTISFR